MSQKEITCLDNLLEFTDNILDTKLTIDQSHCLKSWMDEAQILQGLSYKVCSNILSEHFAFDYSLLFLGTAIIHQHLVAMLRGEI